MNLIASILHLDRNAVNALRITDPYSLHRVVYSLFEDVRSDFDKSTSKTSGILYADLGGDFQARKILLLSNRPPASRVDEQFGSVDSRTVPNDFFQHNHYRFKVIVNPTRRDSASHKLVPVKGRADVAQWFMDRASSSWGFRVSPEHLQVDRIEVLQFNGKDKTQITLQQAHIQGQMFVTDRDRFEKSFASGIGRGRAFGCGLLQIVPIVDNKITTKGDCP